MAFDYFETAQDALDAIAEGGALATVTRNVAPAGDDLAPPSAADPVPATATVTAFGVIFDYATKEYGNQPDALIRTGDRQVLLAAIDVNGQPITEAQLPIEAAIEAPDGKAYIIKNVKPLDPAGVAVLFDIQVRRG